jgi:hypothetical protein
VRTVVLPATMENLMSKQNAVGNPAFLKQQRERLTAMRNQLLGTGRSAERASKAGEAKEMEEDAQDMAQSEVDGTIDALACDRACAREDRRRNVRTIRFERRSDTKSPPGSHARGCPYDSGRGSTREAATAVDRLSFGLVQKGPGAPRRQT